MLDSTNKIEDLINRAVEIGLKGLAITDHEVLSGHIRAIKYVKQGKDKGTIPQDFKLMLGNEIYLVNSLSEVCDNYQGGVTKFPHFILIAKDSIGHKQLRELSSLAWDNSFNTGKVERVPTVKSNLERIILANQGHLIASTACIGGELGQHILSNEQGALEEFIAWCKSLFNEDFYLEMQPSDNEEQKKVNEKIFELSNTFNVPYIITTDAHYLKKEQSSIHEAYLNSREDESRELSEFYKTTYLMDGQEIHSWLDSQIGTEGVETGLAYSVLISSKVQEYDLAHPTIVPSAEIPDFELEHLFGKWYERYEYIKSFAYSKDVNDRYLLKLIEDGFYDKVPFNSINTETFLNLLERIEIELKEMWLVTEKLQSSISAYYISTLELINIMWDDAESLVGVARGSVTGMYTMYLIGLIQMNPIQWNLPHWRHISHEKAELSDVDIDTQQNKRADIIEAVKRRRGERKVLNCCTFKTEGSKSAILTAGRGLGYSVDETSYIANMIPITRGFTWSLKDCLYGNIEEERKPIVEFKNECAKYPLLLETAIAIEGLISGRSIHASAVYLFNEDFIEHNARMKAPNGVYVTQFNMKDSDYMSGLKMDFLTIQALDKIRHCMELLLDAGYIEWQGSLRATYNKYLHPDVIDYDTREMWDMIGKNEVVDLFQFDTQVGLQAAKRIKPHNLVELATANSIMRLMVSGEGAEQPIDTYIRYKNDINEWYKCMREDYKLTEKEIKILEKYLLPVYGVGDTQEIVMELSMDEHIAGFSVTYSNKLRKGIAKKDKDLQAAMKLMFFEHGTEIGTSENMLNYIWKEVIGKQLGYSFSKNHTFPYSAIGLQELNFAYHYPIIFWNTACLIVNAGADETQENNKSTNYGKIATAISNMQKRGISVSLPLINSTAFGFVPDEENNRIIFGVKGLCGIGDEIAKSIIENQPYASFEDFCEKMVDTKIIGNSKMIILIKAGCFVDLDNKDRKMTMEKFIRKYIYKETQSLTLSQFNRITELNIIPEDLRLAVRILNYKKYVISEKFLFKYYINQDKKIPKSGYHDRYFKLDKVSQPFFEEHFSEDAVVEISSEFFVISEKIFTKECDKKIENLREWFDLPSTIDLFNSKTFEEIWEKHASGTVAKWEMDSLSFYYTEHELVNIDENYHGVVDYFELPEEPTIYDYYPRYVKNNKIFIPKYDINRLAGTVLDSDNNKHIITLLTNHGVVSVKFNKGQYAHYNKRISDKLDENSDKKTILEESWFKRGSKIIVCGYRQGDVFRAYRYNDTIYPHTVSKISNIESDGSIILNTERVRV